MQGFLQALQNIVDGLLLKWEDDLLSFHFVLKEFVNPDKFSVFLWNNFARTINLRFVIDHPDIRAFLFPNDLCSLIGLCPVFIFTVSVKNVLKN